MRTGSVWRMGKASSAYVKLGSTAGSATKVSGRRSYSVLAGLLGRPVDISGIAWGQTR